MVEDEEGIGMGSESGWARILPSCERWSQSVGKSALRVGERDERVKDSPRIQS